MINECVLQDSVSQIRTTQASILLTKYEISIVSFYIIISDI